MTPSTTAVDHHKLPRRKLVAGTTLFRIHRRSYGPWFFDQSGNGRFDPISAAGKGACYWALDGLGAWVEVFRTRMAITTEELEDRQLTQAVLKQEIAVVDLADRSALAAGATASLMSGADYAESHHLASAIAPEETGLTWRLRHDMEQQLLGVVLFGPAGAAVEGPSSVVVDERQTGIPAELVDAAERQFGYSVLPDPSTNRLEP